MGSGGRRATARREAEGKADEDTNANKDVDANEVPKRSLPNDLIALSLHNRESPGLADDPPRKHEQEEQAENAGHQERGTTTLLLLLHRFLDSNTEAERRDERDEQKDELANARHQQERRDGLGTGCRRVCLLGTVQTEGHDKPDTNGQRNNRLYDRTRDFKAVRSFPSFNHRCSSVAQVVQRPVPRKQHEDT